MKTKTFFLATLLGLTIQTNGQTINSIAAGDWNSPTTWDCNCLPASTDDVVIKNTGVVTLTSTASVNSLTIEAGGSFFHNGTISISTDLNVTGLCSNNLTILIFGNLTNDGLISGTGGSFCIDDTTTNNGSITGTIDFCDLTPPPNPPYVDINAGSIDSTVTFCQAGICPTTGLKGNSPFQETISVYSNPFTKTITIKIENTEIKEFSFQLFDLQGRLIGKYNNLTSNHVTIYQDNISNGLYLYLLFTHHKTLGKGKILIE
ncbi:MAG: T9SS type A sorting domain-containing protein [Bacteroidetes bacterium]|nr:T9SS type A sorting domain-containing protein [Bacteroidota bacterium]